jgi:hypothetical protein
MIEKERGPGLLDPNGGGKVFCDLKHRLAFLDSKGGSERSVIRLTDNVATVVTLWGLGNEFTFR